MSKERIKELENRRSEIKKRIASAEKNKLEVIDQVQKFTTKYSAGLLDYPTYNKLVKTSFGNRSPQEWVDYYDRYIADSKRILSTFERESRNHKLKLFFIFSFALAVFFLGSFLIVKNFEPSQFTGLAIKTSSEKYAAAVSFTTASTNAFEWFPEKSDQLKSLKISGEIYGEDDVKIFLDEILILDSNNLSPGISSSLAGLTGLSVNGAEETPDQADQSETTTEDTSSETSNAGADTSETQDENSVSSDVESEIETDSPKNEESEEISPDGQTNVTDEKESVSEQPEESPSDTELPQTRKEFSNHCEETCDLESLKLNQDKYSIRIETSGAEVKITSISYELLVEEGVETPEETTQPTDSPEIVESPEQEILLPEKNTSDVSKNISSAPELLINIQNFTLKTNSFLEINTEDYFSNAENYSMPESENFSSEIISDVITIIPLENFTGILETKIIAENSFGSTESNLFKISVLETIPEVLNEINLSSINITTLRHKAIINRPVKWVKKIDLTNLSQAEGLSLTLPTDAENLTVKFGEDAEQAITDAENQQAIEIEANEVILPSITGNVPFDEESSDGIITRIWKSFLNAFRLTGRAITDEIVLPVEETSEGKILDVEKLVNDSGSTNFAVEYYTPGPQSEEIENPHGKTVSVHASDDKNYTDVLAYTSINENYHLGEEHKIKVFWVEEGRFLNFEAIDADGNDYIDNIFWVVPHLSNQTFEIILITKAEHLDENRAFISDIYNDVYQLDEVYSEEISEEHFVRVTFEQNLTSEKDITIYSRVVSGNPVIGVYEKDQNETIATFEPLIDGENKVYLTSLTESQDIFDLLIVNGSVEFDYIVDPSIIISDVSVEGTLYNVTAESGFTHLNISDSDVSFYHPFDVNISSSIVYDYSNTNTDSATITEAYWGDSGVIGGAYVFDGINDKINFSNRASSNFDVEPFTLMFWMKTGSNELSMVIDNKNSGSSVQGFNFYKASASTIRFRIANGTAQLSTASSSATINNNVWHHIVGKRNATATYLYVDGVLDKNTSAGGNFNVSTTSGSTNTRLNIGSASTPGAYFNGSLDEIIFYRRDLTESEISAVFSNQSSRLFSRGEHIFVNKNVSEDGTENRLNVTINSSTLVGSSINVSVGDESGGSYTYGLEYSLSNGFISDIPITTPNNVSLKFIFYAGNSSNPMISPALINSINLTSYTVAAESNFAPYAFLNFPANSSIYWRNIFNLTLNATAIDPEGNNMTSRVFAGNYTYSDSQIYQHGLIYQKTPTGNNTELIYNWTSLPIVPDSSTVLLMHFDNRSEYGENQTFSYDFSGNGNDGAITGSPILNMSYGKFGGSISFGDAADRDYVNLGNDASFGFETNFSVSAWILVKGNGTHQHIVSKAFAGGTGWAVWYNHTNQDIYFGNTSDSINSDCIDGQTDKALQNDIWYHVAATISSTSPILYLNGQATGADCIGGLSFTSLSGEGFSLAIGGPGATFNENDGFNGTIDEVAVWNRTLSANEIRNIYRLNANKYIWKVNLTDSDGASNESEVREVIIRDTALNIENSQSCSDVYNLATLLGQGYNCASPVYPTCLGLNVDLNITSGNTLSLNSSCQIYFNTSSDSSLNLFSYGVINLTGANITASSASNKFDLSSFNSQLFTPGSYGNVSFANFDRATNISDSRINFISVDIKQNATSLLNSTDLISYAIEGGSLERKFRTNVSIFSSGAAVSGANVTVRNNSNSFIFSKSTNSDGSVFQNLTQYIDVGAGKIYQSNFTVNVTRSGFFPNSTTFNLTVDSQISVSLAQYDTIFITTTETIEDVFTRIGDEGVIANLSDLSRSCRYSVNSLINITTGKLIIEGCTIEMNNTGGSSGSRSNLYVSGSLQANYSNLTSTDTVRYAFQAAPPSSIILKNSFVSYTGYGAANMQRGLAINTTNASLENLTLSQGYESDIEILSSNITLKNSRLLGGASTEYNLRCIFCSNVIIQDSNISGSFVTHIIVSSNQELYLRNTNFSTVSVGSGGRVYNQWYIDVLTRNSGGGFLGDVNVTFYNVTGTATNSYITNSTGGLGYLNITQYVINSTGITYQTNYTVNATRVGYATGSQQLNFTSNKNISFNLLGGDTPQVILNSPLNASIFFLDNFNITLNVTVTDTYDDLVDIFIYGMNATSASDMFKHGLIYQKIDAIAGENITYNWTSPTVIPDTSTVLLYHLDNRSYYGENQTFVYDFSNARKNGSANGDASPNMSGGKLAGGLVFDGSGDYISANGENELLLNKNFSWAAWINPKSSSIAVSGILGKNSVSEGYSLGLFNGNFVFTVPFNPEGQTVTGASTISAENWTHIAAVLNFNALTVDVYVNGVLDGSGSVGSLQADTGTELLIGRAPACNDGACSTVSLYDFNGTIDEVAVWNRTLSATEVKDLYRLNVDKHYWKVNATDYSGFSNESETREFNVTNSNLAPQIGSVSTIGTVNPEDNGVEYVLFSFIMNDTNGVADINDSSVRANFTRAGEAVRQNLSCSHLGDLDAYRANYSCTIGMWYFDGAGTWNITVYGTDLSGASTQNLTTFTYAQLQSFAISPSQLTWGTVSQGQINKSSNGESPISTTLNNTGNYNVINISLTAIDLHGESDSTHKIPAGNVTVWPDEANSLNKCFNDVLVNGTGVNITGAVLNKGNHSVNDGDVGQEYLYYCITQVPINIPSQTYSTSVGGSWTIRILTTALLIGGAKRRKKDQRKILEKLDSQIFKKHGKHLNEILEIDKELKKHNLTLEKIAELKKSKIDIEIPISLFTEEFGAAEILCKYLRENYNLKFSEIAKLIGRDQRTVWINYHNSLKKEKLKTEYSLGGLKVSIDVFSNSHLSVLESLISYLRKSGFRNSEIAQMLNKDPRNTWTIYSRALKKHNKF